VCHDLILLDMMLPTIDGTVVLRELKSNPRTKSIPVIVVSGLSQRNEDKLVKSGAAAYLEKSALLSDGDGNRLAQVVQRLANERLGETEERTLGDAR
jgi:CheY-like chemotaxis protein